ncbi:phosphate ABC transporter permease PstA [Kocuria sp. JC486]|uniref:Phosphate transport system permease protein PstA n=1 Tax=Kocuria soli TaxID=2485125 RepID=A0A3N4AAN0_9MICC|nr:MULTISPECIES: phosphate ABC transporter permease PstA [Kocuria]NHU85609.1 phosphate ABC transporter permease PstA [Kocuria sp. JC486]ROZ62785.1 phosphate ABC transporter permease PstA [Kocuria soli]
MSTNTLQSSTSPARKNTLTSGQRPKWLVPVVMVGAVIVGAALSALLGFNIALWAIFAAVIFLIAAPIAVTVIEGGRKGSDAALTYVVYAAFILAVIPLISVIWTVLARGLPTMSVEFLTETMGGITGMVDQRAADSGEHPPGGALQAVLGTVIVTFWATLFSVPIGLLTAIYLVEYSNDNWLGKIITFLVDVMTGVPSIVAGLFASALFGLMLGPNTRMGIIGAIALTVLMIPTVVKATEEMLKIVPNELREASYALGVRKWRTILKVVIPTSISGIASGVTLAIARVIGETAPLLVTVGYFERVNLNAFNDWMATLPTFIYQQLMRPVAPTAPDPSTDRAWGAALILIVFVMLLNLIARLIARAFAPKTGR